MPKRSNTAILGNEFYKNVFATSRIEREEQAKNEILNGNIPSFERKMIKIETSITTDN